MQTFVKTDSPILPSCCYPSPADEWEDEPGEGLDDGGDEGSIDLRTLRWMQMQMLHIISHAPLGAWRMRQAERAGEAADGAEISQLETKTLSACTKCDGVCAVCQCEWEEHDQVRVLPCGHQFHTCCVDRWLSKHKACCPLCKADVCPSAEAGRGEGRQRGAQRAAVGAAATGGAMAAEILESQCPIVYTL